MNYLKKLSKKSFQLIGICCALLVVVSCEEEEKGATFPDLTADFTSNVTTITAGDEISFTSDVSGDADGYAWSFEGGTPVASKEANPTILYTAAGTFKVKLIATRSADNSQTMVEKEAYIVVEAPLAVTAAFSSDVQAIEQGQSVTYTNTSKSNGSGVSLVWTFEGGTPATSTASEVTVSYKDAGDYNVKLEATDDGLVDLLEREDYINVSPIVSSFTASSTSIVEGNTITYTSASTDGSTLAWTFEGGSPETSTDNEVIVTYATPGQYDVTLIASKNGVNVTSSEADYVNIMELTNAELQSTKLASDGLSITVVFDKSLNDPSSETAAFDLKVDGSPATISSVALDANDDKAIVLTLTAAIVAGQSIELSYTPGITAIDGASITAITEEVVTNDLKDDVDPEPTNNLITNFDMDFESGTIEDVFSDFGGTAPDGATKALSTDQASSGTGSVHIKIPAGGNAAMTTLTSASAFTLDASKTYTMSFNVYTITQGAEFTVRIQPLAGWAENKIWTGACCGMDIGQWSTREWEVSGADIAEGKFHFQFISTADSESEYYLDNFSIVEKE